jgi:peptidyl-prolyl cis-trans isomerase D
MLKQLGRLKGTRNVIIVGFVLLMAVSLIVFYAPGRTTQILDPTKNTEVVAKVGRDEITVADLARVTASIQQMYGGQISLSQLGGNKRFLDQLIRDRVVAQEAERLGLGVSDAELREKLEKEFSDPSGRFLFTDASGKRDLNRYKDTVNARYGSVEQYEEERRRFYAAEKLRAFVTASVVVSDDEVEEDYKRKNSSFDVAYVVVSPEKLAEKIQPTDEELKNYYAQHKTEYRYLEPQKKIRYLYISQDKSGAKLQISDKDLHDEFDRLAPENKQSGVKVQQILLRVARKDLDAQVEQKAKDLLAKLRGNTGQGTEEAFAEAAKGNSEDPATARNGGFLAAPFKKNPNKPHGLYDRTIDMQPGDVSDIPIKYAGNWYILRRGDAVMKTFEEAKPDLLASLRNRRGYAVAAKLADRAQARLKETKDPNKVANELATEANMSPKEMVRETPYIKPADDVPEIGSNQQFEAAIAPLNNANDVGERTGVKGGFAIPMLVDKKEPRIPDFEEVKDQIAKAMKQQRAKEQLEQKAKEIASSLKSAADIKAAGEKAGLDADVEEGYKLGGTLGKAGTSHALDEAIYSLKDGEFSTSPIKVGDSYVIVGVIKKNHADLAQFASQRDQLKQQMLSARQTQVFEDYIAAAQQRMKQEGKIKIYTDVLARMEEEEPIVEPPTRPRLPFPTK